MLGDDSSSWLDDVGGVLGITPPPPQTAEPAFDGGMGYPDIPTPSQPSDQDGGGWFDQVKDYVTEKVDSASEWLKEDDPDGQEEKGVLESIWDIFDGDDEAEGEEVDETEEGEEADETKAVFGDQPEDDPWWSAVLAVDQRAQTLQMQMNSLLLGSKPEETREMKFVDPQKQALHDDIVAFNNECADIKGSWDQLDEGYRGDAVLDLEYKADTLEAEIQPYMGAIEDHDGKSAEKLAIITRAIQPIQNQVLTQEAIVKYDKQKVDAIKQSLDNQKLVAQVNVGLGLLNVALGSFPPTAIIATGMTLLQMGMQPSESGAVELGSELAGCLTKSMKFTSKLAGGMGTLANLTGFIDQCKEDRDQYVRIYENLQTAINRLNSSSQTLSGLMQKFNTQLSKAQQYASKATGV